MSQASQVRTYDPAASVVFLKTNEQFGGLSNMAPGFPLRLNGVRIRTSEALYQACRFPNMPDVQRRIIDEHSPMTAKMCSKPFRKDSRPDWDAVRVKIMRWCLRVKLAQNWKEFGRLLLATGERPIVEQSRKDDFWGAKVAEDGSLVGMNVLGRLLMELREQLKSDEAENLRAVEPLSIPEFLLFQKPIETLCADEASIRPVEIEIRPAPPAAPRPPHEVPQPSLFDQPMTAQGPMDIQNNRTAEANSSKNPKPYSGYRDSGHPWLRPVPEHWEVVRSKYLFREVDDRTDTGTETLLSMRQAHGLIPHEKVSTKPVTPDELKGYKRVRAGQLVLNRMQASNGMFAVAREDGLVSPDYAVFRLSQPIEPAFFVDLFKTNIYRTKFRQESRGLGTGTSGFLRLYSDRFGTIQVPQPPEKEQTQIVAFIDSYDRRVRRLIRNKRRLIGLLNEQKQAIINQAVTRGLEPNAPMKPTGTDWMPEVPAHWEVKPLKQMSDVLFSNVDKHSHEGETRVLLCNYTDVYKNDFITSGMDFMPATATPVEIERFSLELGDVMITKDSEAWNDIGVPAIVTEALEGVLCGYHLALIRADRDALLPMFLFRALTAPAIAQQLYVEATGVTRYGLSKLAIKNLLLPRPPVQEQADLVAAMAAALEPLSASINRVHQEISLVREYRDRLIADVITGKLDVRQIEIAAPADEPISDDDDVMDEDLEADNAEVIEGADADG